ncbi:MAG: hypothetical protein Q9223_007095 [Gallowayella weberi]
MPGVPSGRGCDACRKQKKKRRYKFKNETVDPALVQPPASASRSLARVSPPETVVEPSRTPNNRLSSLTAAFIHSISQQVDIKFQLPWNFGGFLHCVPPRLGRSEALDAAIDSLVTAHKHYCVGGFAPNELTLTKYSRALAVLRHDLDDVAKARSSESLCAVLVISIAQV